MGICKVGKNELGEVGRLVSLGECKVGLPRLGVGEVGRLVRLGSGNVGEVSKGGGW